MLIARDDRKLRIEVGYGLEGSLTDLTAGRIIREVITPNFRNGNFDQGVIDGVSAIIAAVRGEFSDQVVVTTRKQPNNDAGSLGLLLLFALFNIGKVFGGNRMLTGGIGAVIFPVIGALFLGFNSLLLLALIPAGFLAGFLASLVLGNTGDSSGRRGGGYGHSLGGFGGEIWIDPQDMRLFLGLFAVLYIILYPVIMRTDRLKYYFLNRKEVEQEVRGLFSLSFSSSSENQTELSMGSPLLQRTRYDLPLMLLLEAARSIKDSGVEINPFLSKYSYFRLM